MTDHNVPGVLNIISEHFVEAANSTSIDTPYGVSEWDVSGLHPAKSTHVRPPRVKESIYATECRLYDMREFESRDPSTPGKKSGVLVILEGVNFWVREDALNEERNMIDPSVCLRQHKCLVLIRLLIWISRF